MQKTDNKIATVGISKINENKIDSKHAKIIITEKNWRIQDYCVMNTSNKFTSEVGLTQTDNRLAKLIG